MGHVLEVVEAGETPPVWAALRNEAEHVASEEPSLASLLNAVILSRVDLASALSYQLARKLGDQELRAMSLREIADDAYAADPSIIAKAEADLRAVFERDPACKGYLQPFLYFKGFLALQTHRVAHFLWNDGREGLAFYLQSRVSELFQVDIHPAVSVGQGAFFDHGTGIVIGETTVIGEDVSMLQNVTLGGTGRRARRSSPQDRPGRAAGRGRQGARQHPDRRLRQDRLGFRGAQARAAPLHRRRRAGPAGQLPNRARARPHHGSHPGRGGVRLRDLRFPDQEAVAPARTMTLERRRVAPTPATPTISINQLDDSGTPASGLAVTVSMLE